MKISKKPDKLSREFHEKLIKAINDPNDIASMCTTYLGIASLMCDHIMQIYPNPFDCPVNVQYPICQLIMHKKMFKSIFDGEFDSSNIRHLPTGGDSWKTDEDFEKRSILVIKTLYEQYKEEGKI